MANNSQIKSSQKELAQLAQEMGLELVDVALSKEAGEVFLRIAIDKAGAVTLDDCEKFHKRAVALVENIQYDYLECSSPGLDYAFKRKRDFERNLGREVEVRLFAPKNGKKQAVGKLNSCTDDGFAILCGGQELVFSYKEAALVRLYVDFGKEMS